jgi:hypothetical protein
MNTHDHRRSYPGDHGIRFEPIELEPVAETVTIPKKGPRKTGKKRGRVPR